MNYVSQTFLFTMLTLIITAIFSNLFTYPTIFMHILKDQRYEVQILLTLAFPNGMKRRFKESSNAEYAGGKVSVRNILLSGHNPS